VVFYADPLAVKATLEAELACSGRAADWRVAPRPSVAERLASLSQRVLGSASPAGS
jgi:hypothetical protein